MSARANWRCTTPENHKQFVPATVRNLLIYRMRHEQITPIESDADLDSLGVAFDATGAGLAASARWIAGLTLRPMQGD